MKSLEIFFAIFTRTFSLISLLPIFSARYFPLKARSILVFFIAIVLYFAQTVKIPTNTPFIKIIFLEILIGSLFGCLIRIYFEVINIVASLLTMQHGLLSSYSVSIHSKEQGSLLYNFLFLCSVLCIFACNIHHIFLKGLVNSYSTFPIGGIDIFLADWDSLLLKSLSQAFKVSLQLASACLLVNLTVIAGSCILSKIVPMIQVFFLLSPIQLPLSLLVLSYCLPSFFKKLIDFFEGLNQL